MWVLEPGSCDCFWRKVPDPFSNVMINYPLSDRSFHLNHNNSEAVSRLVKYPDLFYAYAQFRPIHPGAHHRMTAVVQPQPSLYNWLGFFVYDLFGPNIHHVSAEVPWGQTHQNRPHDYGLGIYHIILKSG